VDVTYLDQRVRRQIVRDLGRTPGVDYSGMLAVDKLSQQTDTGGTSATENKGLEPPIAQLSAEKFWRVDLLDERGRTK
jgi:hypothetical protein